MAKVDFNCYVGNWPFHRIRNNTLEDLKKLHKKVGIDYGYVSALEAIFYHDPYEADALLAKEIEGEIISADSMQVYRGMDMVVCEEIEE